MARITIEQLGPMLKEHRGGRGIRAVAAEIGISSATLSRIESGKQPDLETFARVCRWLGIDASEVLGCVTTDNGSSPIPQPCYAHFKTEKTMT